MCRSANVQGVSSSNLNEDNFLGVVTSDVKTDNPWTVTLQLSGIPVKFHIDTGTEVTVVSEAILENVGSPINSDPIRADTERTKQPAAASER